MNKNVKSIFFVLTLLSLILTVSAVSAVDDDTSDIVSQTPTTDTSSDVITTEDVQSTSDENNVITENHITKKEEKTLKTETNTVNVSNYDSLYNAINNNNDENLIINLESGDYYASWVTWSFNKENVQKVTINGNNNSMRGQLTLSTSYEFEFNNITLNNNFILNNLKNVTINSSTINGYTFTNNKNITIENTNITSYGNRNNYGNMTLINSIVNNTIHNYANAVLVIDDDTVFESNFGVDSEGEIISNRSMIPYMSIYNGDMTIENCALTGQKTNNGNLILNNATFTYIYNKGNLIINNSFVNGTIRNYGNLTISDDCELGTGFTLMYYEGNILSDINRLIPYMVVFSGNLTIENFNNTGNVNNGNLTLVNSNINIYFSNKGNLTIKNSTINGTIVNSGILIIDDDTDFDSNFILQGNGQVIINDTSRITPYLYEYRGDYTINNSVLTSKKNNYGNLTIINSTVNDTITNYARANLTFIDSVINNVIYNKGYASITIINSFINNSIDNAMYGNVTIKNSTINGFINNPWGNLIITDDVIFDDGFWYSGTTADSMVEINNQKALLSIDALTLTPGQTATLKVTVKEPLGNAINGGKITFKINGKTVKDENGKVIYAKVSNGQATVNYTVPTNFGGKDITVTAAYSGSGTYPKTSKTITTTVTKTAPALTTADITANTGDEITLTANITDGDTVINAGKVVFKVNGKTLKDERGKVIYVKVSDNQVNLTYTLPADMKAKEYNLTAVFISSDYDRLEDTKILTIT